MVSGRFTGIESTFTVLHICPLGIGLIFFLRKPIQETADELSQPTAGKNDSTDNGKLPLPDSFGRIAGSLGELFTLTHGQVLQRACPNCKWLPGNCIMGAGPRGGTSPSNWEGPCRGTKAMHGDRATSTVSQQSPFLTMYWASTSRTNCSSAFLI
jgi:hypothetical protein